jgi:hypothetical protein
VRVLNPLFEAALEVQKTLQGKGWQFCFIGGLAVLRWGEIRMTQDVDLCLLCGFGNEKVYVKTLLSRFKSRIEDAEDFAVSNRVLLISASNGVEVDMTFSGLPFEEKMIARASAYDFSQNCEIVTCSAEDLIVTKAFADRFKDWADIEGIFIRQGEQLDQGYVLDQLKPLCEAKESPEILEKLKTIFRSSI